MHSAWRTLSTAAATLALASVTASFHADARAAGPRSGYLCCNLHYYGDWISDINYRYEGTRLLRAGTPIRVVESSGNHFTVEVAGQTLYLGNDYSRGLSERDFLERYIVRADPRIALEARDPFVQDAVRRLRVMPGMHELAVAMALAYPVADYTPSLAKRSWEYWLDRGSMVRVHFDADRRVRYLEGEWEAVRRVLYIPSADVIRAAQQHLNTMSLDAGEVDGLYGPRTRAAIRAYQEQAGLARNGLLDLPTLRSLGIASPVSAQAADGTAPDRPRVTQLPPVTAPRVLAPD